MLEYDLWEFIRHSFYCNRLYWNAVKMNGLGHICCSLLVITQSSTIRCSKYKPVVEINQFKHLTHEDIPGSVSITKCCVTNTGIPMIRIRQFSARLVFKTDISHFIPKYSPYMETGCRRLSSWGVLSEHFWKKKTTEHIIMGSYQSNANVFDTSFSYLLFFYPQSNLKLLDMYFGCWCIGAKSLGLWHPRYWFWWLLFQSRCSRVEKLAAIVDPHCHQAQLRELVISWFPGYYCLL